MATSTRISNLCSVCDIDFGSLSAFDMHRVGRHAYAHSPERPDGRRCLDEAEMSAKGMRVDAHGRWRSPAAATSPWSSPAFA